MKSGQFPKQVFHDALLVTKKIRSNMKPFLEQYSKGNIPWIFQSMSILFHNMVDPSVKAEIKMNSMFAVKCIVDSCQYIPLALIEVYFLPIIKKGAEFDPTLQQGQRGLKFFSGQSRGQENIQGMGYNYVKLCTEMSKVLSVIKPRKLYYNQQTQDPSYFTISNQQVQKKIKHPVSAFAFFKQDPKNLTKLFEKKLNQFDQKSEPYSKFVEQKFFQQIKAGFANPVLDIRQLIKGGDMYISDDAIQIAGDVLFQGKTCNILRHALEFITSLVVSGNFSTMLLMHQNQGIKNLVKAVINVQSQSKKLDRGQHFMPEKKGSAQQRKMLYIQFLRSLQLWANTYTKTSLDKNLSPSRVSKYYKMLKQKYHYEFPSSPLLSKQLKQTEQNLKKNKSRNQMIKQSVQEEVQPEKDDSIINGNGKGPQPGNSNGNVKQAQVKKQVSGSKNTLSKQKIEETPAPNENDTIDCRNMLKKMQTRMQNLTASQKQLPNNMAGIQNDIKTIDKFLQTANIDEVELQQLMTEFVQLESKYETILPHYQSYKTNKIDYKKFCASVNPPKSSRVVSSSKIQQKVQNPSQRSIHNHNHNEQSASLNSHSDFNKVKHQEVSLKIQEPVYKKTETLKQISQPRVQQRRQSKTNAVNQSSIKQPGNNYVKTQQQIKNESAKSILGNQPPINESRKNLPQQPNFNKNVKPNSNENSYSNSASGDQQAYQVIKTLTNKNISQNSIPAKQQPEIVTYNIKNELPKIHGNEVGQTVTYSGKDNRTANNYSIKVPTLSKQHHQLEEHVNFEKSSINESRYTNSVRPDNQIAASRTQQGNQQRKLSVDQQFILPQIDQEEVLVIPDSKYKPSFRKLNQQQGIINNNFNNTVNSNHNTRVDYRPVTYTNTPKQVHHHDINISPIKRQLDEDSRLELPRQIEQQMIAPIDEEFIQGPSLNPLANSYHDLTELKPNNKTKTFKQVISTENLFIKTNKKQNLYWLESDSNSLIRPVNNSQKKSRVQSRINVPELLEERSKKYEMEIKLIQHNKDKKIRQLQSKLNAVERQKSFLSLQVRAKQNEIKSMRESSEADPVRSKVDQYSLLDDQNYLMKKLAAASNNHLNKRLGQSMKSQSRILTTGKLINTKVFSSYFERFNDQKQKKIHMKNKQLLYKDKYIEIGYMGHLQGSSYKITIFITPEGQFVLENLRIQSDNNLKISHDFQQKTRIYKKTQARKYFIIDVLDVPYAIPQVKMNFRLSDSPKEISFILPCGFHKFFTIKGVDSSLLTTHFQDRNVIRGEEIPYSKKILKNVDLLQDFLPHIQKINKGEANSAGEVCFGGEANFKRLKFIMKISIKPNQFLYIQVQEPWNAEERNMVDFYVATLNHFLMKDISWN